MISGCQWAVMCHNASAVAFNTGPWAVMYRTRNGFAWTDTDVIQPVYFPQLNTAYPLMKKTNQPRHHEICDRHFMASNHQDKMWSSTIGFLWNCNISGGPHYPMGKAVTWYRAPRGAAAEKSQRGCTVNVKGVFRSAENRDWNRVWNMYGTNTALST